MIQGLPLTKAYCNACSIYHRDHGTLRSAALVKLSREREKVPKPDKCSHCQKAPDHEKGYNWRFLLDTYQWLCTLCYKNISRSKQGTTDVSKRSTTGGSTGQVTEIVWALEGYPSDTGPKPRKESNKPDACPICHTPRAQFRFWRQKPPKHPHVLYCCEKCYNKDERQHKKEQKKAQKTNADKDS